MQKKPLGNSSLNVTPICFGTSALGSMPDTYGYEVTESHARETLRAIFNGPVNFLDTSNNYGFGRSESRIGAALEELGGLPDGFVLSTKVDRDMETGRFDAARVRESVEESLAQLKIDSIPLLHLHDPEHARDLHEITKTGGALDELFALKEEGIAQAVGLAMGSINVMFPILKDRYFDALISHNRYTLLNRSANEMFDYAFGSGTAILNAAPYAGGVLAKGSVEVPRITYQTVDDAALVPVRCIESLCSKFSVPMGAVALQFSVRDSRITSTIAGVSKASRVAETLEWATAHIPDELWEEFNKLGYSSIDPEANRDYRPG